MIRVDTVPDKDGKFWSRYSSESFPLTIEMPGRTREESLMNLLNRVEEFMIALPKAFRSAGIPVAEYTEDTRQAIEDLRNKIRQLTENWAKE